jgi:hypothetical protein
MNKRIWLPLLLLIGLVLAACGRSTQNGEEAPDATPTQAPPPTASQPGDPSAAIPACTVRSAPSRTPEEDSLFAPVTENDWIKGPLDAKITLIEYSDFQ